MRIKEALIEALNEMDDNDRDNVVIAILRSKKTTGIHLHATGTDILTGVTLIMMEHEELIDPLVETMNRYKKDPEEFKAMIKEVGRKGEKKKEKSRDLDWEDIF